MPEDKKKFKPQNFQSLMNDNIDSKSAQDARDSSSPGPVGRKTGSLMSASGHYKLNTSKNQNGGSSVWPPNEDVKKEPVVEQKSEVSPAEEPNAHQTTTSTKMEFKWDEEEEEWPGPGANVTAKANAAESRDNSSSPWATTRKQSPASLQTAIKELSSKPVAAPAAAKPQHPPGYDSLSRFRLNQDESHLAPRDLMGASRQHGDFRRPHERDEGRSFGRFDRHDFGDDDDLDWQSGRQTTSMRRQHSSFNRHEPIDAAQPPPVLRPIHSTAASTASSGAFRHSPASPNDNDEKAKEEIESQKELMHQARQRALEMRLAKERSEEEAKQARIAERMAALDAKEREKKQHKDAEKQLAEERQRADRAHRQAREREMKLEQAARRHAEDQKEKAMEESWSDRKRSNGGQPLSSMRRGERAHREPSRKPQSRTESPPPTSQLDPDSFPSTKIVLPTYGGDVAACDDPENIIGKFPTPSTWQTKDRETLTTEIRVSLPST